MDKENIKFFEDVIIFAKHAIGLDYEAPYKRLGSLYYKPYRNYYCTKLDEPHWKVLTELGYAEHTQPSEKNIVLYGLTSEGLQWLSRILGITIYEMSD